MPMKVSYIEIPARDLDRAVTFYSTVFGVTTPPRTVDEGVRRYAIMTEEGVGVSINQTANFDPGDKGTLVYFEIEAGGIDDFVARVLQAGGLVAEEKTAMGEWGFYAIVRDTEGNSLAVYAPAQ